MTSWIPYVHSKVRLPYGRNIFTFALPFIHLLTVNSSLNNYQLIFFSFCTPEFINNIDTDKPNPYLEDCIAKQEPIIKVTKNLCSPYETRQSHTGTGT